MVGFNYKSHNGQWKGKDVGYAALHEYMSTHIHKPLKCHICKLVKKLELANISGTYKRVKSDWEWICRRCHMLKDGRLNKFIIISKSIPHERGPNGRFIN